MCSVMLWKLDEICKTCEICEVSKVKCLAVLQSSFSSEKLVSLASVREPGTKYSLGLALHPLNWYGCM